ncbi:hypothetical protein ACHAXT_001103 [Thalassiosira profunda]
MAARPRLVHEGSPIEDGPDLQHPGATTWSHGAGAGGAEAPTNGAARSHLADIAAASKAGPAKKPYKLQTTLVIGQAKSNDDDDDLDMMAMDDVDHNQLGGDASEERPASHYYGAHGHVYHHEQQQQQQQQQQQHMPAFPTVQHQQDEEHPASHYYGAHGHVYHGAQMHRFGHTPPTHQPAPIPPPAVQHVPQPDPSTSPLVVLDAANIAYNYAESLNPTIGSQQRRQPDPRGIRLAIEYFLKHNCRVQAVVPISWYQLKPRPGDHYHLQNRSRGDSDAKMVTDEVEELRSLRQQGFLVACPPGDDDDAYVLALARREGDRLRQSKAQQDESMGMEEDNLQQLPASVLGRNSPG